MGDTIFLSATLDALEFAYPAAEISVLVPAAFAPVLRGHPAIREILTYDEGFFSLARKIRAEKFDYFLQLHASPSARWLAWASGAQEKRLHFQNSETEKAYGKHPNALEWDIFFLRRVVGERIPFGYTDPKIYLSSDERAAGAAFWQRRWRVDGKRVVFLGLGASRKTKRWPPAYFAQLAELLRARLDLIPAFAVGPGEEEEQFAADVINHLRAQGLRALPEGGGKGDFIHIAGLPLRELAGALSAVRAYVGNDSGPKHLAAAVETPTFTFFGPEDPGEWHPYKDKDGIHTVFFRPGLSCRAEDNGRWCGIPECVKERHRCMTELDPFAVFRAIEAKVGKAQ